jgi:hypothetical protein
LLSRAGCNQFLGPDSTARNLAVAGVDAVRIGIDVSQVTGSSKTEAVVSPAVIFISIAVQETFHMTGSTDWSLFRKTELPRYLTDRDPLDGSETVGELTYGWNRKRGGLI